MGDLETLVQNVFERALDDSGRPPSLPQSVKPDIAEFRQREQLAAQLRGGKEVKHEAVHGAGRLLGITYQAPAASAPGAATVWALVQPTKAAGLRTYFNAGGGGFSNAGVEGFADFSRHSGVDCEAEVAAGGAWSGEASIAQKLGPLPLTLKYGVGAKLRAEGLTAQRGRIHVRHTTSAAVPLPRTSAELHASLAVPATLGLDWLPKLPGAAAAPGSSEAAGEALAAVPAPPPSAASLSLASLGGDSAATAAAAGQRRRLTLKLQPRNGRHELQHSSVHMPPDAPPLPGAAGDAQPAREQKQKQRSYVPQLQMEVSLPDQGRKALAPQDVTCSWRQAWGPYLSSSVSFLHAAPNGACGGRQQQRGGQSGAALPAAVAVSNSPEGGREACTGDAAASPSGLPSPPSTSASSPSTASLGGLVAGGGTWPRLQCELSCRLGGRVMASGSAVLDASSIELPGSGRWELFERASLAAAVKSSSVKLKWKLGGKGSSGRRVLTAQSSFGTADGPCYSLSWQQGSKGGGGGVWDDGQRMRSELSARLQPAARRRSLRFDLFVPFG